MAIAGQGRGVTVRFELDFGGSVILLSGVL